MAVREIVRLGHPVLRQEARELSKEEILSPEMKQFVTDLWDTMAQADGLGLAATQVGESVKVCVLEVPAASSRYVVESASPKFVLFNPSIRFLSEETIGIYEGCLSLPNLRGLVPRCSHVEVSYLDETATKQTLEVKDFLAVVFQHEVDHLYGKLYIDRMEDLSTLSFEKEYHEFHMQTQQ